MNATPSPLTSSSLTRAHCADPAVVAAQVLPLRRELLHAVRWRPPVRDRRSIAVALVVVLVIHLFFAWFVREAMREKPYHEDRRDVIQVTLIERPEPEPIAAQVQELPPLAVSSTQSGAAHNAPAPPRRERGVREVPAAAPTPVGAEAIVATPTPPSLYNADGSLRIAPVEAVPATPRDPMSRGKLAARELRERGHNIVRCRSTRFARAYAPDESVGDGIARKYLAFVGLYNPHTAKRTADAAAEAIENCDWED